MIRKSFGCDMDKWYIAKRDGRWCICPPSGLIGIRGFSAVFSTGREALAVFAGGGTA